MSRTVGAAVAPPPHASDTYRQVICLGMFDEAMQRLLDFDRR